MKRNPTTQTMKDESLDKIVNSDESKEIIKKTGKRWLKTTALAGAFYLASLFIPTDVATKEFRYGDPEPQKPNATVYIVGGAGIGFITGLINYFIYGKPERRITESEKAYESRCNTRFWTYEGIFTGIGIATGTGMYIIDLNEYNKDHPKWEDAQKKVVADDGNIHVPSGPFITGYVEGNDVHIGLSRPF